MASISVPGAVLSLNGIPFLDDLNFNEWKDAAFITLAWMGLDLALWTDEPTAPTAQSTYEEKTFFDRWERSNRLSLLILRSRVSEYTLNNIPECRTVREFLDAIEAQFVCYNKARIGTLISKLLSMKYTGSGNISQHILEMRDIASQLNAMELKTPESFLVHLVLISLPSEYEPFRVSYNMINAEWTFNELLVKCMDEEARLKGKVQNSYIASHPESTGHGLKKNVQKNKDDKKLSRASSSRIKQTNEGLVRCFFCKKKGHRKNGCKKYKNWMMKKKALLSK
ncbi:unnamed protein product [Victoria cruziana]